VPREPKPCIDILPNTAEHAPFRSNFAEPLVVDIEAMRSKQETLFRNLAHAHDLIAD